MCEQLELDQNFEPLSVAAEAVVARLRKARLRAERGDRLGWIVEQRMKRGAAVGSLRRAAPLPPRASEGQTRVNRNSLEAVNRV